MIVWMKWQVEITLLFVVMGVDVQLQRASERCIYIRRTRRLKCAAVDAGIIHPLDDHNVVHLPGTNEIFPILSCCQVVLDRQK
jgi:hypothetical protein